MRALSPINLLSLQLNPTYRVSAMAFQSKQGLYPDVAPSNTDRRTNPNPVPDPSPSLYQQHDMENHVENHFPEYPPSAPPEPVQELLIRIPGAILHLIDKHYSVELACGDLTVVQLRQGDSAVAVIVAVGDEIQWPLGENEAAVKLDSSHYFFSLRAPKENKPSSDLSDNDEEGNPRNIDADNMLNYGLTFASKGQEDLLEGLDGVLEYYTSFSVQKVTGKDPKSEVLDGSVAMQTSPAELVSGGKKKEMMEGRCAAYWTALAPNVEDYSGIAAKLIAVGSGQLIKGILWCGDVTVDRLKCGSEVMQNRITPGSGSEISPQALRRIKRVKGMTKMSEKVATGALSGVLKVSGFFTSSVANSKVGKKFIGLLPGEIVVASLDGFNKVCDAVEVAGRNVMSTSSTVTTDLVSHRYGTQAAEAAGEGLGAAGHAMGTAWAVFKIRKALDPKSVIKPTNLAKTTTAIDAAADKKAKSKHSK